MEPSCIYFIERLTSSSSFLKLVSNEVVEYWLPDPPPVIVMFATLGKEIYRQFDAISDVEKESIFNLIEEGITSTAGTLKTVVATGIVEGLVGVIGSDEISWLKVSSKFGDATKRHAQAWRNA